MFPTKVSGQSFSMITLLIISVAFVSVLFTDGDLLPGLAFLIVYTGIIAFPTLFTLRTEKLILALLFIGLLLDVPGANPYYEHTAFTEILGHFIYDSVQKITGIPIPFTFFEIFSFSLVAWILFKFGRIKSTGFTIAMLLAVLIPAVCFMSAGLGILRGNSLSLAITQLRFLPILSVWFLLGYFLAKDSRDLNRILQIVSVAMFFKSIYALFVYFVIFGGTHGDREYIIDHLTSLILGTSLICIFINIFYKKYNVFGLIPRIMAMIIITLPYLLNDRRASFLGVMISIACIPFVISRKKLIKIFQPLAVASPFAVLGFLIFAIKKGTDENSFLGAVRQGLLGGGGGDTILSYRQIEDFNLMQSVISNPILGLGFGRTYPIYIPMPDISFAFELFNAIPHNTVLFLWAFAGPLGVAALGVFVVTLLMACVRVIKYHSQVNTVIFGFVAFSVIIQWLVFVYFDIGLLDTRALSLAGLFGGAVLYIFEKSFNSNVDRSMV